MNISGIRSKAGFYDYNAIRLNKLRSKQISEARALGLDDMEDEEDDFEDDNEDDFSASFAGGAIYFGLKTGGKDEKKPDPQPPYDYHDTHWETSFDWKDEDNDGYDDRDDGFWTP